MKFVVSYFAPYMAHGKYVNALQYIVIKVYKTPSLSQNNMDNCTHNPPQKKKIKEKELEKKRYTLLSELTRLPSHDELVACLALVPVTLFWMV